MKRNAEPSGFPMASSAHHTCWIRKEAVMAATTFNAPPRKEHVREQFGSAFREMLDAFVSNRMRQAAAEAEHVGPRRPPGKPRQSINT
jgi:hypothetical protein